MPSPCPNPRCHGVISAGKSQCPECKTNLYSPELEEIVRTVQEMCVNSSYTQPPYVYLNKTSRSHLLQGVFIICDVLNQGYCPSCKNIHQNPCWYIDDCLKESFRQSGNISKASLENLVNLCLLIKAEETGVEYLRDVLIEILIK